MAPPKSGETRAPGVLSRWEASTPPRRIVGAVIAFGVTGLLLGAILLVGLVGLATTANGLVHEQDAIAGLIDSGRATAADGRAAADRAQAGVSATAEAAAEAAGFVGELAAALRETASSLRVDILGSQPFAAAADRVDHAANQANETAAGLRMAAGHAREGASSLQAVSADLDRVTSNMAGLGSNLTRGGGLDAASLAALELALAGLVIWLAVPSAACVWFGIRLWRRPGVRRDRATRREPIR